MKFSVSFVAQALNQPLASPALSNDPGFTFTSIVTDSRKIAPGCLFVALPGEKFDGHDFIDSALAQGARGILCRKGTLQNPPPGVFVFSVPDTLAAYRNLASAWRKQFRIPVIAVAGSVGKTTTKELLAALLRGKFAKVLKTEGSQNGFVGIPMTLLELRPEHEVAVIEIGIDEIGAMEQHIPLVEPTIAVLTAIGPEHLEKLRDIPTVAKEEALALSLVSKAGGAVVVNLDDPWIRPLADLPTEKKQVFTLQAAPLNAKNSKTLCGRIENESLLVNGHSFPLPLPGAHNAGNLLAAVAVALTLGLTTGEIAKGLATFRGASGRSEIRELPGKTPVLCDYYNASPSSMAAAFTVLTEIARKPHPPRARWACLGDMLELGPEEELFHRNLAGKLIELGVEHVLLYGPRMKALYAELHTRNFKGSTGYFESKGELAKELVSRARQGEAILIKGSRGMRMEDVWQVLEQHAREHWGSA